MKNDKGPKITSKDDDCIETSSSGFFLEGGVDDVSE